MSKKRSIRSTSTSTATESTTSNQGTQGDNQFQAQQLATRDTGEVADEKAADSLAYKVVAHMQQNGQRDLRGADPTSQLIPSTLAAAFQEVAGVDVSETPLVTAGADQAAADLSANAFAIDNEVWMPLSQWRPTDPNFLFLLAHEVAHVAYNHVPMGSPARLQHTAAPLTLGFLKRGANGDNVRELQTALVQLGYMTAAHMASGPGIFGPKTHQAVTAFQAANRLVADGIVGPKTEAAINSRVAAQSGAAHQSGADDRCNATLTGRPALREGDEGVVVKELQRKLNEHGARLYIDGEFGPATKRALVAFQRANNLEADGVVGPNTANKLVSGGVCPIPEGGLTGPLLPGPATGEVDVDDGDPGGRLNDSRLNPQVRRLAIATIKDLQQQGLSPYVVDGFRSFEKQNQTYAQGRTSPGQIVTYVRGGGSWHNYGLAVDIAFWNNAHTRPSWDAPMSHWNKLGNAGKRAGFTRWMGDEGWDYPHLEYHPNWGNRASNLIETHRQGGLQAVWNKVM